MSRLFITGDTHCDIDWNKLNTRRFPVQKELTRSDHVLIAGDFGGIFELNRTDEYIIKEYTRRRFTTLFIDGNHENHDALDSYPVTIWNGGKVHMISDSVIHLMRGQVYEIDGKKIFTMGGAQSTDTEYREEGKSWWRRELPSAEEYEEALKNLAAHDFKVDYVVTHCAPEEYVYKTAGQFNRSSNALTVFLSDLIEKHRLRYKDWFWGHYHTDTDLGNMHCLYRRVLELTLTENGSVITEPPNRLTKGN